jgi:hypothetical protein
VTQTIVAHTNLPRAELSRRPEFANPDVSLRVAGRDANVSLPRGLLEAGLGRPLHEVEADLLEIASILYVADKACPREERLRYCRDLAFLVPVRCVDAWAAVSADLSRALSFLTGDNFAFTFVPRAGREARYVSRRETRPRAHPEGDCVNLISGGLDSFAGALAAIGSGLRPVLVNHHSTSRTEPDCVADHVRLAAEEAGLGPVWYDSLGVSGLPRTVPQEEDSQRARSFLYLSLAAIVGSGSDIVRLVIPENGVLAIHLPLTPARVPPFSTLTAHPVFLDYFRRIVSSLFGRQFEVTNPLVRATKREVFARLEAAGMRGAIARTVSCGHSASTVNTMAARLGRVGAARHCGTCIPCIHRQIGAAASGLEDADAPYVQRVPGDWEHLSQAAQLDLLDVVRLAHRFLQARDGELVRLYPALMEAEVVGLASRAVLDLHRQFAQEVGTFLGDRYGFLLDAPFQAEYDGALTAADPGPMLQQAAHDRGLGVTDAARDALYAVAHQDRWRMAQCLYRGALPPAELAQRFREFAVAVAEEARRRKRRGQDVSRSDVRAAEGRLRRWPQDFT